jgi:hypothetical protein
MDGARALAQGASRCRLAGLQIAAPNRTTRFLGMFSEEIRERYERLAAARAVRRKLPETPEEAREPARTRVLSALRAGCKTRGQLRVAERSSYQWCLRYDSEWLDNVLPRRYAAGHRSWNEVNSHAVRKILLDAIQAGACTRKLLARAKYKAFCRALRDDSAWLDSVLPRKHPGSRRPVNAS